MREPAISKILSSIGPEVGVKVELEPKYGFVGELVFRDGRRHLFRNSNFNVNRAGSVEIAKDKDYTKFFLTKYGFSVPKGMAFFSDRWNDFLALDKRRTVRDAITFAEAIGFPVFCKPNNMSQGRYVTKARTASQVEGVTNQIFSSGKTDVALVEECVIGKDYRVVVLGDKVISAYQRKPLDVTGDGVSSIAQLIEKKRQSLPESGRPNSEIQPDDVRIRDVLASKGIALSTIPLEGHSIEVLDNANLSSGGTSVDVTRSIHPDFIDIAVRATKALGLRLCGVDIICENLTRKLEGQNYYIIELNGAPGLDNYAAMGDEQYQRVRNLYKEILIYLAEADI